MKKTVTKKAAVRKTPVKQAGAKEAVVKRAAATHATAKDSARRTETTAEKTAVERAPRTVARKVAAKKAVAGKAAHGHTGAGESVEASAAGKTTVPKKPTPRTATDETAADKAAPEEPTAGKTGAGRAVHEPVPTGTAHRSTAKKAGAARAAKQTGATTVVAKKTPGTATAEQTPLPKARAAAAEPGELAVRSGEDPWTPEEVAGARAELDSEAGRLRAEISSSEASVAGLMRDSGDGAGDDEADTGTKNITREHEMALAANAREMLDQTERALERLDAGTYGLCENCGNPIGKARMQAFPRATLCVECKQKQERRS
ncbi:TraR/DksA C4-type zinc finger protein [Streptomyces sp. NPDC014991]|uniref:TraR/DksA C4-type zinc finger protein n=1 Tax=Streptomyces sp. NPDC014991 TaxID=3364935 RepID=UPI0036FCBC6F